MTQKAKEKFDKTRLERLMQLRDTDHDKIPNMFDCDPFDPTRDGFFGDVFRRVTRAARAVIRRAPIHPSRARAAQRRAAVRRAVTPHIRHITRAARSVVRRAPIHPSRERAASRRAAARREITRAVRPVTSRIREVRKYVALPATVRRERVAEGAKQFLATHQAQTRRMSDLSMRIHTATSRVARVIRGFERPVMERVSHVEERAGVRVPTPVKEFAAGVAFGAPATTIEMAGMVPGGVETLIKNPRELPAAAEYGMYEMGHGMWKGITEHPFRTAGEFVGMGAIAKGASELPKVSPYYLGKAHGVKPFTGRPSFWGRLKGESPHPTPEAKMSEMYDPRIYAEQQKFFHGTSMQFLKSIVDRGKMLVHPEAVAVRGTRGVESSLFLSKPGTPYTTFATPETILRIGKGAATKEVRSSTLEQLMTGQLTQQQRLASGLKDVKASGELKSLISKRGALQRELAELEKSTTSDISPKRMKTEAELYDIMRKIDKLVADEYGKATGERVRISEEPGAFLMVEETPARPSATIIEKAMRREALRASEKKGTITKEQTKELRRLERELQKESIREYFDTPVGTVFPSPKPTWGYEWKGIPEAEFTMRAGSELYPMTTVRSQLYARFGITKGTHFVHDPYTGRWMEVLKVSPTPTAASTKPPIIDIPELLYPIKKGIETLTKPKLTAKQKSELIRIDKEIEKAATDLDYRRVGELQNRRRTILYGDRIRGMYLPRGTITRPAGRLQGRLPDIVAKTPDRMLGRLPDRVSTVPPPLTPPATNKKE